MGKKRGFISAVITITQIMILTLVIMFSHTQAKVGATAPIHVTGRVTDQTGLGLRDISVYTTEYNSETPNFGPVTTSNDGSYDLTVSAGVYDIHFVPNASTNLNPIVKNNITIFNDLSLDAQLTLVTHTFSGVLTNSSGVALSSIDVLLLSSNESIAAVVTTDDVGRFSLSAAAGKYHLELQKYNPSNSADKLTNLDLTQIGQSIDLRGGDVAQDLRLSTANLYVTVKDENGNPLQNVNISASATTGSTSLYPNDPGEERTGSIYSTGTTNSNGIANLGSVVGLVYGVNGSGNICATISGVKVCYQTQLTVTGDMYVTIIKPVIHNFSGTLTNSAGDKLKDVNIILTATSSGDSIALATTNNDGYFSVPAVPGRYYLRIQNNDVTVDGIQNFEFSQVDSAIDLTTASITQNLKLNTVPLHVTVRDSAGNLLQNAPVTVNNQNSSTTLYPNDPGELSSGSFVSRGLTGSNGRADLMAVSGQTFGGSSNNYICSTISDARVCVDGPVLINGETNVSISAPTIRTFSGKVTNSTGQSIAGVTCILALSPNGTPVAVDTTDNNGQFNLSATSGKYFLTVQKFSNDENIKSLSYTQISSSIDLTSSNYVQDLKLNTADIHVTVKDSNGNPIANSKTSAINTRASSTSLYQNDPGENASGSFVSSGTTDSNGNIVLTTIVGQVYGEDQNSSICADIMGAKVCLTAPITITGEKSVVLQAQAPIPPAPLNLSIVGPTQYPTLAWSSSAGAKSYNVYRNNIKIASINSLTYNDNTAPEGINTYYLTAVNESGESSASNNVSVLVDRTVPSIAYTASPLANANTWNKDSVVLNFSCSDNSGGSGVAMCSPPVTLDNEGINQVVTSTVTDNAGNIATVTATVNIDKTMPTISYTLAPAPNNYGWNKSDVVVTFNCTDILSGIQSCSSPVTLSTAGADQRVTGIALDKAGNMLIISATVNIDKMAPGITGVLSPVANAEGWNNANTTVSFNCTDALSGVATCTSPVPVTAEGANQQSAGIANDRAGNTATLTKTVKLDKTSPTVTAPTMTPDKNVRSNTSVTITASAVDSLSGVKGGEFYIDTDPGKGNGTPMTYANSKLSITTSVNPTDNLNGNKHEHIVYVRSKDLADNWSSVVSYAFTFK